MAKEAVYSIYKSPVVSIDPETKKITYGEAVEIMKGDDKKSLRRNLAGILSTKNVDSEAAESAVEFLGGDSWAELFAKAGDANELITVKVDSELKAEYKRGNVAKRVTIAGMVKSFSGKIYTDKTTEKTDTKQVVAVE